MEGGGTGGREDAKNNNTDNIRASCIAAWQEDFALIIILRTSWGFLTGQESVPYSLPTPIVKDSSPEESRQTNLDVLWSAYPSPSRSLSLKFFLLPPHATKTLIVLYPFSLHFKPHPLFPLKRISPLKCNPHSTAVLTVIVALHAPCEVSLLADPQSSFLSREAL